MSTTAVDPKAPISTPEIGVKAATMTVAAVGVAVQLLCLLGAINLVPKFENLYETIGPAALPAVTVLFVRYGLSAGLLGLSLAAFGATWWGTDRLRVAAAAVAVFLPVVHIALFVLSLFLPLLEIVETLGPGE